MKRIALILALAIITTSFAPVASAQDFGVDLSYMSTYVWRGAVLTDDSVFQPSLTGAMGNLSVNLWGNMNLTDENGAAQMNEWDYTVDYSTSFDAIGLSVGIIGYTFPNSGGPGTTELYMGASYDTLFSPSVTIYQDIEAVSGTYVSLGAGYGIPVGDITCIDISGSLGFGSGDMNIALYGNPLSGAGLADVLVGVSAPFTITDTFSVTPSVSLASILDADGQDAYEAADSDYTNVFFGLTASAAF